MARKIMFATGLSLALFAFGRGAEGDQPKAGPPFVDEPPAKEAPAAAKPAVRDWSVEAGAYAFDFSFKPGIPDPNQVTEILLLANRIPKTPHPKFGSRVPLQDARIVLEIARPSGGLIGRFLAHAMPLSRGKYGLHFTPTEPGLHRVRIEGETASGEKLEGDLVLPVAVWPLPADLEATGKKGRSGRRVIERGTEAGR